MSFDPENPYTIAGKNVQGGLPVNLEILQFIAANNLWEFVTLPPAGEINLGANVGIGAGLVFRDKTGVTLNFKSLIAGVGITINNNANDIEIIAAGGGSLGDIGYLSKKEFDGKLRTDQGSFLTNVTGTIATLTATAAHDMYLASAIIYCRPNGATDDSTGEIQLLVNGVIIETCLWRSNMATDAGNGWYIVPFKSTGFKVLATEVIEINVFINALTRIEATLTCFEELTGVDPSL